MSVNASPHPSAAGRDDALFDDWNPELAADSLSARPVIDSLVWDVSAAGAGRASGVARRADPGFALEDPAPPAAKPAASDGHTTRAVASPEEPLVFPRLGEAIGGFRLIGELGRGAFARVYLAHESALGNRPVALKVSRAEGDEPRVLARLQHAHIVPIHSVCDDRATGLRLICMPYLGGANLAQVLDAAASRTGRSSGGRSLIDALDLVARPGPAGEPSRAEARCGAALRDVPPAPSVGSRGSLLASLRRSLFGPVATASAPARDAAELDRADDERAPARPAVPPRVGPDPRLGLDRGEARRGPGARPFSRPSPPRPEALEHPRRRRRHADAPRLQPRGRVRPGRPRRRRPGHDGRDAPLHGARAPRRLQPPRLDRARGGRRAVGHLRARADPLRDDRRPPGLPRAARGPRADRPPRVADGPAPRRGTVAPRGRAAGLAGASTRS